MYNSKFEALEVKFEDRPTFEARAKTFWDQVWGQN